MGGEESGFTIIETMLYLAVTGLLAMGVLMSAGYAINAQRYRDVADSLVNYLQAQYDETANVQNDRLNTLGCSGATGVRSAGLSQDRGTSDCVVLGKFLQTTDGSTFTSTTVYGVLNSASAPSDIAAIKDANPFVSTVSTGAVAPSSYSLEWSARLVQPKSTTVQAPVNIFIVRSPASGTIMTFVGHSTSDTPLSIVDNAPTDTLLCVDPIGFYGGTRLGALLTQATTNASGIKLATGGAC